MPIKNESGQEVNVKYEELSDREIKEVAVAFQKMFLKGFLPRLMAFYRDSYVIENPAIDLTALEEVVIRVDKRKEHAKIFHNITDSVEYRTASLYCYWIIKLHPFSIDSSKKHGATKNYMDSSINEQFAVFFYTNTIKLIFKEKGTPVILDKGYIEELLYTFRYRDLNKANMVMLFEPRFETKLKDALEKDSI